MNKLEQLGEDQRIIDQLTAALAEARAEVERLENELAAAEALLHGARKSCGLQPATHDIAKRIRDYFSAKKRRHMTIETLTSEERAAVCGAPSTATLGDAGAEALRIIDAQAAALAEARAELKHETALRSNGWARANAFETQLAADRALLDALKRELALYFNQTACPGQPDPLTVLWRMQRHLSSQPAAPKPDPLLGMQIGPGTVAPCNQPAVPTYVDGRQGHSGYDIQFPKARLESAEGAGADSNPSDATAQDHQPSSDQPAAPDPETQVALQRNAEWVTQCAATGRHPDMRELSAARHPKAAVVTSLADLLDGAAQPAAPDPRDAEIDSLHRRIDDLCAQVARLTEALAAGERVRLETLDMCDRQRERAECAEKNLARAEQKLAEREAMYAEQVRLAVVARNECQAAEQGLAAAEREMRSSHRVCENLLRERDAAEARVRELEAELAQLKGRR